MSAPKTRKPARVATIAEPDYVNPPSSKPPQAPPKASSNVETSFGGQLASGKFSGGDGKPFKTSTSGPEASFDASVSAKPFNEQGQVSGHYGKMSYDATGKMNATGSLAANGTLNYNGLSLSVDGKLGAQASASLGSKLSTNPMTMGDVPVTGRLEGAATASATLGAYVSGSANFTAHPLAASLEGKAGASACAKIGTNFNVGAGPFNLSGNVYGTAGFEATAGANAGYKNGMLQFGANAGVAPGKGFGGGFQATVNTAELGQMTNNFISNPTGRPQPSTWDQAVARQQMQQEHAGYYQNVAHWVEGGSW